MRFFLLNLLVLGLGLNLTAQTDLTIAQKQYELMAYHKAAKSYQSIIEKGASDTDLLKKVHAKIADCYYYTNNIPLAAQHYQKSLDMGQQNAEIIERYARCQVMLGNYEGAKATFQKLHPFEPGVSSHFMTAISSIPKLNASKSSYKVKKHSVSSDASDFGVTTFRDQIVFSSSRKSMQRKGNLQKKSSNTWGMNSSNQLFIESKGTKNISFLRSDLRNEFNEGPICYSPDGKTVVFTKNNFLAGNRHLVGHGHKMALFVAEVKDNGDWENAKPFEHNGLSYSTGYPAFSSDGQYLYFISDRPDGLGGFDIFVSQKSGKSWGTPQNLGFPVNSPGNEISPEVDGNDLYFASDWHAGLGGYDIFKTTNNNGFYSAIANMGGTINSNFDDYGVKKVSSDKFYFVSNRDVKSLEDIYVAEKPAENFVVTLVDGKTKSPISNGKIQLGNKVYTTTERGKVIIPKTKATEANVSANAYYSSIFPIEKSNSSMVWELTKNEFLKYTGLVVDEMKIPLSGVNIEVSSKGKVLNKLTDSDGRFEIDLNQNEIADFSIFKEGFAAINKKVTLSTKTELPTIILEPIVTSMAQAVLEDKEKDGNTTFKSATVSDTENKSVTKSMKINFKDKEEEKTSDNLAENIVKDETKNSTEKLLVEKEVAKKIAENTKEENSSSVLKSFSSKGASGFKNVFAIQVGAFSTSSFDMDKFEDIADYKVYTVESGELTKVRVGPYQTSSEAKEMLSSLKAKGYKGYVFQEKVPNEVFASLKSIDNSKEELMVEADKTEPINEQKSIAFEQPKEEFTSKGTAKVENKEFALRIASYKNPKWFEYEKVSKLGQVSKRTKGEWTIFYISGLTSRAEANEIKSKIGELGYKSAYIVNESEEGKLEKM